MKTDLHCHGIDVSEKAIFFQYLTPFSLKKGNGCIDGIQYNVMYNIMRKK